MALMMLKTHDLTWQDHTINVEMMLAPLHAQLLASKHKALSTRCNTIKLIYDKERDTMVKNINIEKRLMERKRSVFLKRKSEIAFKRMSSAKSDPTNQRCLSIPSVHPKRGNSAPPVLSDAKQNDKVFLTEIRDVDRANRSEPNGGQNGSVTEVSHPLSFSRNSFKSSITLPYFTGSQSSSRNESPLHTTTFTSQMRGKSVRFEENEEEERSGEILFEKINYARLQQKVRNFVHEQDDFNNRPSGYKLNFRTRQRFNFNSFGSNFRTQQQEPPVAKKCSKLSLNKNELERAFDKFCENKTKDNLHAMMKMATKQKASIRIARDQSIVPAIAVMKSAHKFRAVLGKNKAPEDNPPAESDSSGNG